MPAPQAQQASRAGSLPAAGAGGSRSLLVAAAAAVQLPSTTAAPGPAAPAPAAAAAVAAPVPVPPRPAASPLLSRMKDMWFGSGKKQAAAVGRTSADAEAGGTTGRALPFGGAGDAPAPWQVQQGAAARQQPQQQPHQQAPRQQQMSEDEAMARAMQAQLDLEEREKQERRHERRQRQQQEAEQQPQQPQQQPVQQRPLHELKRELRDLLQVGCMGWVQLEGCWLACHIPSPQDKKTEGSTHPFPGVTGNSTPAATDLPTLLCLPWSLLQAIKEQESGGMYERAKVDKVRGRETRGESAGRRQALAACPSPSTCAVPHQRTQPSGIPWPFPRCGASQCPRLPPGTSPSPLWPRLPCSPHAPLAPPRCLPDAAPRAEAGGRIRWAQGGGTRGFA